MTDKRKEWYICYSGEGFGYLPIHKDTDLYGTPLADDTLRTYKQTVDVCKKLTRQQYLDFIGRFLNDR